MRTYRVVAANGSATSDNKIHDDDVARRYGFGGGLVPGVTLYAYLTRPVVETWGRPWLERGEAEVKFVSPVYDGEKVTAALGDDGSLELRDSRGNLCAIGSVRAPTLGPWIHVSSRIRHFRAVSNGQLLSTRARVASCCERGGNHFVELEVLTLADGRPALFVYHTAIWQLRPRP